MAGAPWCSMGGALIEVPNPALHGAASDATAWALRPVAAGVQLWLSDHSEPRWGLGSYPRLHRREDDQEARTVFRNGRSLRG